MSKLFLTNSKQWYSSVKETLKGQPFRISFDYTNKIYAVSTHKLLVHNENAFSLNTQDFILVNGTYIYKGNSDISLLANALRNNIDICEIRKNSYGNYCVAMKNREHIYVFTEESNCYDVFYYSDGLNWLISTSLADMAKVLRGCLSINRLNVLEEISRYMIINDETYFNEIKKLGANQFIHIIDGTFCVENLSRTQIREFVNIEENIQSITSTIKEVALNFYSNYGDPSLGATGGLDSRMNLAAYLSIGSKPSLAYGFGNSLLAPSMEGDVEIDKQLSESFDLTFTLSEWNETKPIDKLWDEQILKYGSTIYDGCEDAFKFYTRPEEPFLIFGYMGEFFREFEWLKNIKKETIKIQDYIDRFHVEPNDSLFQTFPDLYNHVLNKWKIICEKNNIDPEHIKKEDLYYINMEYRHRADSVMVNNINRFKYAHYLLSEISILSQSYVPIDYKYDAQYMLRIIKSLYPHILEIPFFSHCKKQVFDSHTNKLKPTPDSIMSRIKKIIPKSIKSYAKSHGYYSSPDSQQYQFIYDYIQSDNNINKLCRLFNTDDLTFIRSNPDPLFTLRALMTMRMFDHIGIDL